MNRTPAQPAYPQCGADGYADGDDAERAPGELHRSQERSLPPEGSESWGEEEEVCHRYHPRVASQKEQLMCRLRWQLGWRRLVLVTGIFLAAPLKPVLHGSPQPSQAGQPGQRQQRLHKPQSKAIRDGVVVTQRSLNRWPGG